MASAAAIEKPGRGILSAEAWQFSLDKYVNPFLPPSGIRHLPYPVAHFFGHRTAPPRRLGNLIIIAWAFLGVFCGVSVVNVTIDHIARFRVEGGTTAITVGSFGAAAVLEFYAIESPLAQPRSAVLGQVLSSLTGVAVAKLFALAGPARFATLRWLAASLACAAATAIMALTGTVHPPAGATALIAVTDVHLNEVGWYLVPAVLLGCVLMQCVALIVNNIQRRFPIYWWSPEEVGQFWRKTHWRHRRPKGDAGGDGKGAGPGGLPGPSRTSHDSSRHAVADEGEDEGDGDGDGADLDLEEGHVTFTGTRSREQPRGDGSLGGIRRHSVPKIVIERNRVLVPDTLPLRPEERLVLETLSERL